MSAQPPGSGSMMRRILLGSQLRRLREARGITREQAGYSIRASESKISRMELGRVGVKERDVADLLTYYGVDDNDRETLLDLTREASVTGWWHGYGDLLPGWFQTYVGLEEAAASIQTFEVQFVHGLAQTEEYARAVVSRGLPAAPDEEVERRVDLRMRRQRILGQEDAPCFSAVLDEAALRRALGGPQVMRGQLNRLLTLSEMPNVHLQVMPFGRGAHAAEGGAFTVLGFPDADLADVVYLEQLTSALYIDKRDEVAQYSRVMDKLRADSLSPRASRDLIRAMLQEL
ncbi:helix-turn-helix transcriptional regulator [Streptomyces sp. SL13]|uniref:Helix-turn-helix transcriptional regulator n=1 Tax=Streptantibioticus silvisoli TaxID=2705255 RepID=A0AA90H6P2_9ACTN|nr:helix-turn-helix transcriptional regulator [Streptantibioticus silvisoli]MDI5966088.1 helix-turn-helix transcriptional regulator [Streptantibioticus silvisoli]MDI5971948.1 helix-turn-helix transcriptional regulator [Streptantibioticus silvisoli]